MAEMADYLTDGTIRSAFKILKFWLSKVGKL